MWARWYLYVSKVVLICGQGGTYMWARWYVYVSKVANVCHDQFAFTGDMVHAQIATFLIVSNSSVGCIIYHVLVYVPCASPHPKELSRPLMWHPCPPACRPCPPATRGQPGVAGGQINQLREILIRTNKNKISFFFSFSDFFMFLTFALATPFGKGDVLQHYKNFYK